MKNPYWGVAVLVAILTAVPDSSRAQGTLTVVAYNIRHGAGMDETVDLPRIAEALRALNADVITLQEVDKNTERTGGVDQVAVLAELLGMRGFHGAHRPYQGGEYGNAVLSRLPVRNVRTLSLPPSAGSALTIHEVEIAGGAGRAISVVSVHLAGSPEERAAQADSVVSYFSDFDHPVILAGDFNSRRGDRVLMTLSHAWQILDKEGDVDTFPADVPDREIDFIMVRPAGAFEILEHRVIAEAMASDHRPILATFRIW